MQDHGAYTALCHCQVPVNLLGGTSHIFKSRAKLLVTRSRRARSRLFSSPKAKTILKHKNDVPAFIIHQTKASFLGTSSSFNAHTRSFKLCHILLSHIVA